MGNRFQNLVKDTFIFAIGNIGSKLILFFLVPLYTTYMTKEQYGTSDLIFTVAQLFLPFVSIVIYDALIRFGLSKDNHPEDVLLVSTIVLGIGAVLMLILTPLFDCYGPIGPWKWQLSLYIILCGFNSSNMNYLKVKDKNIWYTFISLIHTALMAVLNIILLAGYHMGIEGYLLAHNISIGFAVLLSSIIGKIPEDLRNATFRKPLFVEMVKYSSPLILNNISWWVVQSSNKVMVEMMIGAEALGLYSVSAKIPALINVMINIFSQAWVISAVKEFENSNDAKFYTSVFNVYTFICFGASIILVALTKPFLKLYVSVAFYESWRYVPILLASAAFAAIAYYYGSLYGAIKKPGRNMGTTLLAAVTNTIVSYVGIKMVGLYGAAIGTLFAYIVMAFVRMIDIGHYIPIKIDKIRFTLVCNLVLIQAVMVTIDFYGCIVSGITVIVFAFLYHDLIKETVVRIKKFLKN